MDNEMLGPILVQLAIGFVIFLVVRIKRRRRIKEERRLEEIATAKATARQQELDRRAKEVERCRNNQEQLAQHYENSPLLQQILYVLCAGDTAKAPEEIRIFNHRVEGRLDGRLIDYDFASNRIPFLEEVSICRYNDEWQCQYHEEMLIRPQVALATAINRHMKMEYDLTDHADIQFKETNRDNDDRYFLWCYRSDYVLLRLKPTKNF